MKLSTIPLSAEKAPDYEPFYHTPRMAPKLLKDLPAPFASALAHEVRNPLTNINLSVEMLEAAIKDDELKIYVDIIKRSALRITNLVSDLLRYQNTDELQAEKHSIEELLDEVLEMAKDRIGLKHVTVRKDYALQDCQIALHRQKVKIALTNIIINALDAMPHEQGELRLVTQSIDGKYTIRIEDNGCGISQENLANIFKPFFTNKPGGLGIGLATTYDILLSNHVGVSVESEEGVGTSFILLFDAQYNIGSSL
ncbi:MAG TPA: ATP-binding protein [Chryseolinea sp.]|nr:ATP-binding protein [Chryseolinea sp.]